MQRFQVVLEVTVNAVETVSTAEMREEIATLVEEFEGGTVRVVAIAEQ